MVNYILLKLVLPFAVALILGMGFTYLVRILAVKMRWISIPREERWNTRFVALMGGIAIFASFVVTGLIFQPSAYTYVSLGALLMFGTGFYDDRFELKPIMKFLLQFLAASLLVISGFLLSSQWSYWLAIPLTYLWVIGITNAFNLLDNMDGLAAGIATIVAAIMGGLAYKLGSFPLATFSFILAGATGGFLIFNYNPAKIFMGDCGSLFVGYILACLPLLIEPHLPEISSASFIPLLVAIMAIPIFDTTLVTFMRIFKGRAPSQGGSDHSSHRLVYSGLSEKGAVNLLYSISLLFGLLVLFTYPEHVRLFYILFAISLVGLVFYGLYLARMDVYKSDKQSPIEVMIDRMPGFLKRKVQLAAIIMDIVLIIAAFTLAHFIRFELWTASIDEAIAKVLPGIIVLQIVTFALAGLYNSVWKYAGVAELSRIIFATLTGAILAGVYSEIYLGSYISSSVFIIDWFLLLLLISASRFAFKGLRRLLAIPVSKGTNVLIYGAGDAGWLALSEIRQNPDLTLNPVGFMDDSPYKQKGVIQGLKILGSYHDLMSICERYHVQEVLVCIRKLPEDKKEMIHEICNEKGIKCREFLPSFNEIQPDKPSDEFSYTLDYQN